jgi:exopolyphosphatase/guanosine-5'-triphosphate,3'-diphosphate pyrophosphatase
MHTIDNWATEGKEDFVGIFPHEGKVGIIDIGSNSVRLVVYDALKRSPLPLFNEKVMCGLGKNLAQRGTLNPEGVEEARKCIARFLTISEMMDVAQLNVVATAAIRDASDGAQFVRELEKQHGLNIEVISGEQEAKLAAQGVMSSFPQPRGLAGDLGGASMELVAIDRNSIDEHQTLPIGPLRFVGENGRPDPKKLSEELDKVSWLGRGFDNFYAVGGSFRALAKIHMTLNDYPLPILHHYQVSATEFVPLLANIAGMAEAQVAQLPGSSDKRAELLPAAAKILHDVLVRAKVKQVIFSASGIREGYLFQRLSPYRRNDDPLVATSADLALQNDRVSGYAKELFGWMAPLFPKEEESLRRLRFSACILSELAWSIHPEFRAEWAFDRVLRSAITGLTHQERVMVATACYFRYSSKMRMQSPILTLMDERREQWSRVVGLAANLAYQLSGGVAGNLFHVPLVVSKKKPLLEPSPAYGPLLTDAIRRKVDLLAEAWTAFSAKTR